MAVVAGAVLTPLQGGTPAADAAAPSLARCVRTSKPYDVGTTTVQVHSGGRTLETTVAYPASSTGTGATPACGEFPLVVVAHGSQGTGASAAALHTYLVRRGYLLASPTFPGDITDAARDRKSVV